MDDANVWGKSRPIIFLVVLALHLAILALLVSASRTLSVGVPSEHSIEVMLVPPAKVPKVRAENTRPERLSTNIAIALAPPVLNSSLQSGASSSPDGHGSAVNWAAEAHRALRAFEIRRDQPPSSAISVSSSLDDWWPGEHRAGDQFKTDSGDWIVWINANCYQIASWHSNAIGASPPRTICPPHRRTPRDD
ncbi:MAG TPA: hypothetical protein VN325_22700 [Steroidobacteraceae bacterium]|nr:hypothetical protein [Steroidobacteraceae bacterium]